MTIDRARRFKEWGKLVATGPARVVFAQGLALFIFVNSVWAHSEPFVVSDAWPKGDRQPTHCRYTLNGDPAIDAEVEKLFDGSVRCMMDVASAKPGKNSLSVVAVNKNVTPEDLSAAVNMDFDSAELNKATKGLEGSPVSLILALVGALVAGGFGWWWARRKRA